MKHLIETADSSSLATVPYDRIVLDSTVNDIIVKGGYEYVDLGLPSGLKWAKCNVGAEKETDYGYYFQWGDIKDKSNADCSWATYKHCNGSNTTLTKYGYDLGYGVADGKTTLDPEDDAARAHMGGDWRMPTKDEIQELFNNKYTRFVLDGNFHGSGVSGCEIISEINGNSIFIPAAGYRHNGSTSGVDLYFEIWASSSGNGLSPDKAYSLTGNMEEGFYIGWKDRCYGLPVRGVFK